MKNPFSILFWISIALSVLIALYRWFEIDLFYLNSGFALISLFIVLCICTVAFVIAGVVNAVRNRKELDWVHLLPLWILAIAVILCAVLPIQDAKMNLYIANDKPHRMSFISNALSGNLKPELFITNRNAVIYTLPPEDRSLSMNRQTAMLFEQPSGGKYVWFYWMQVSSENMSGLVYSEKDIAPKTLALGQTTIRKVRRLEAHWYYAICSDK